LQEIAESAEMQAWDMVNSTICSWLLNIIDPKIRLTINDANTAKIMWHMKKRYGVSDIPKKHDLKAKIANCKQSTTMTAVEYYATLVGLWSELDAIITHHQCTCGNYKCKIGEALIK